jgi:hypothetical protein
MIDDSVHLLLIDFLFEKLKMEFDYFIYRGQPSPGALLHTHTTHTHAAMHVVERINMVLLVVHLNDANMKEYKSIMQIIFL